MITYEKVLVFSKCIGVKTHGIYNLISNGSPPPKKSLSLPLDIYVLYLISTLLIYIEKVNVANVTDQRIWVKGI